MTHTGGQYDPFIACEQAPKWGLGQAELSLGLFALTHLGAEPIYCAYLRYCFYNSILSPFFIADHCKKYVLQHKISLLFSGNGFECYGTWI